MESTRLLELAASRLGAEATRAELFDEALGLWVVASEIETLTRQLAEARVWRAKIRAVDVATSNDGRRIGKARVHYETPPGWENDPGHIDTGWTSDRLANLCARAARANIGQRATFWQLNEPDTTGKSPHGFRRVVWIDGPGDQGQPAGAERAATEAEHREYRAQVEDESRQAAATGEEPF